MYLNERAVCVEGIEVIVEDSFANDVKGELTKAGLHVYRLFGLGCCLWGKHESLEHHDHASFCSKCA